MTTQDYINQEIRKEGREYILGAVHKYPPAAHLAEEIIERYVQNYGDKIPEHILLRAKVRELTDQLAGERARCANVLDERAAYWERDNAYRGEFANMAAECRKMATLIRSGE